MRIRHILYLAALAFPLLITSCRNGENEGRAELVNVGDPVPVFSVIDKDGVSHDSANWFSDRNTMLVFFQTDCSDCEREMGKVHALMEYLGSDPTSQVITVARGQTASVVEEYWAKKGFGDMQYYLDPDRKAFSKFAAATVPRFYLIAPDNTVVWKMTEYLLLDNGKEMTAGDLINVFSLYRQ